MNCRPLKFLALCIIAAPVSVVASQAVAVWWMERYWRRGSRAASRR